MTPIFPAYGIISIKQHRIQWLKELAHCENDIDHMERRLEILQELFSRAKIDVSELERFNHQIWGNKVVLQNLRYNIKLYEHGMIDFINRYPTMLGKVHYTEESELKQEIERFRLNISKLKNCFIAFMEHNYQPSTHFQNAPLGKFWVLKIKNYAWQFGIRRSRHFHPFYLFQK